MQDTTIEIFDRGSAFALRDILTVRNAKRVFNFYANARLDGLENREELEGSKIIETFSGRDDRLVYRSATYTEDAAAQAAIDALELGSADE